jgi:transglutaminase-like putative cysteine protease
VTGADRRQRWSALDARGLDQLTDRVARGMTMRSRGIVARKDLPPGRLSPLAKARLVAEILAAYVPLRRVVRRNDLPAMVARARAVDRAVALPGDPHDVASRLGEIVGWTLKVLPTDGRCLIQSLVLVRLLAARSIAARVVIGVRGGDAFAAHAWVEHDAVPVLPAGGFDRLMEL